MGRWRERDETKWVEIREERSQNEVKKKKGVKERWSRSGGNKRQLSGRPCCD